MSFCHTAARLARGRRIGRGKTAAKTTDPASNGSLLRSEARQSVTIRWPAAPGKKYKAQYRSAVTGMAWSDLPGLVVVNGTNAFQVDTDVSGRDKRFYRVVVVP